jgi:hypothetical protein
VTKLPDRIAEGLRPFGLVLRGGFTVDAADGVPELTDGRAARSVLMIGNVGEPGGDPMWRAFAADRARFPGLHPMNDWTRAAIDPIAHAVGVTALYPFDGPPYHPFQKWAMRAEPVSPSPLGLFIHPEYGLWHAYRAALVFAERVDLPPRATLASPCDTCTDKPCLTSCPVGAFTTKGYDVPRCADFLETKAGEDCMDHACRARRACPVAPERAPVTDQARFHMEAFRRGARLKRS